MVLTEADQVRENLAEQAGLLVECLRTAVLPGLFDLPAERIFEHGSLSKGTFVGGDVDLLVLERGRRAIRRRIAASRAPAFEGRLREAIQRELPGSSLRNFRSRWTTGGYLLRFALAQGGAETGVDVLLARFPPRYLDMYRGQMAAVAVLAGSVEGVAAEVRRMKRLLKAMGSSGGFPYRRIERGIGGIGAEQLVMQSGGAEDRGWRLLAPGSFARAMAWIYTGRTGRPLPPAPGLPRPARRIQVYIPRRDGFAARLFPSLLLAPSRRSDEVIRLLPERHYEALWRTAASYFRLWQERGREPDEVDIPPEGER